MRVAFWLLLCALAAKAQDLRPRGGAGWEGFKPGTSVRIKRTWLSAKKTPRVTISTWTLKEVGPKHLTLDIVTANAVGIEQRNSIKLPRSGEAGAGESARTQALANETIFVAGAKFDCQRTRTTVTGPQGKRIITEWTSTTAPRMRIKRTEEYLTATGRPAGRFSLVLTATDAVQVIGSAKLRCLKYSSRRDQGGYRMRGISHVSREIPGYEVMSDIEATDKEGVRVFSIRVQVLDFTVK